MLTQIYNGQILTPSGWINGGSLLMEDSRIVEIRKNSHIEPRADTAINALGMYVVPGGIELHCHGGGGHDFMEGTMEAFREAVLAHRKHGTTAIFPTLSSSTLPMMEAAAHTCDELIEDPFSGVLGLHLEGPYFNPLKAGAQMPELIRLPDPNEYEHIVEDFNCIKRWDSAPELPGVIEMGRYLTNKDVLPSIAHTAAEYDHVKEAYEAGYTHATHFYNGMPGFHNVREFKHAGTVEAVYLMENMTVEMIADGIHVPPTLLKLVYHTKGVERTAMVTDALAVAASNSHKAFDPRVIIEDGVCKLADRSALAGSIATMDRLISTAVHMAEIPLQDACRMVAETPARIMGVYDRKGSLQRGKDADILILDKDIKLHAVYCMGNRVILDDKI
ncbi:MAG: N-acetylglucosamine-6-phosphate deacetylase [Muribaculaceae bacterium]|nr:N-acetylglucosamine-6-phosphate deacetylase [Muribaculaceae bacterium]